MRQVLKYSHFRSSLSCCGALLGLVLAGHGALLLGADCNRNGVEDAADIETGLSRDCNRDGVPEECESVVLHLGAKEQGFVVGKSPRAVVAGDFNGDGLTDLATGNRSRSGSAISLLLSRGGGMFAPETDLAASDGLLTLAAADLDLDGDLDAVAIVAAVGFVAGSSTLALLENLGGGSLGAAVSLPVGGTFVTAADLTGDDMPDLVTLMRAEDKIALFENLGGGRLGEGTFGAPLFLDVGHEPSSVLAADLDGDGLDDLAVTNEKSNSVAVLLRSGDALFAPRVDYATEAPRPSALVAGDFDDDGDLDLAVATRVALLVLLNDGRGALGESTLYEGGALSVLTADLDGDTDLDLTSGTATNKLATRLNTGDGTFDTVRSVDVWRLRAALVGGDFDGDGDFDVAVTAENPSRLVVLWNKEPEAFTASSTTYKVNDRPHAATIGDADGDGNLDFITSNGHDDSLSVLRGRGDGTLAPAADFPIGGAGDLNHIAAVDLDLDGDLDLVTADVDSDRMQVYPNPGNATFAQWTDYDAGAGTFMVTTGDLDADGDHEVISANSRADTVTVLFNNGVGAFPRREDTAVGSRPVAVSTGDLDGDGDLDLAVANSNSSDISVLSNSGDGTLSPAVNHPLLGTHFYVAATDLDGDEDVDLAVASTTHVVVLLNLGGGEFNDGVRFGLGQPPYSLITADVDGDGFVDVVTGSEDTGAASLLRGDGDGVLLPPLHFAVGGVPRSDSRFVIAGDLDHDGDMDLVSANHTSVDVTVLLQEAVAPPFEGDFLSRICTKLDFHRVSVPARGGGPGRTGHYILPARDDPSLLSPAFPNTRRFPQHADFLAIVFPGRFPALTMEEYDRLVGRRQARQYFAGAIQRLYRSDAGLAYGFDAAVDDSDAGELLHLEEVRGVFDALSASFALRPLGYLPQSSGAQEIAKSWENPGFPVYLPDSSPEITYVPYTRGVAYGRVRILDREGLAQAGRSGEISFQSILVLDEGAAGSSHEERSTEGVVSGVVTGSEQSELSHLAIQAARRGTPNAFVASAATAFAPWEGKLVRLEVRETDYVVEEAVLQDAEAFWASHRPTLPQLPGVDRDFGEVLSLAEIGVRDQVEPQETLFGAETVHLARLAAVLSGSSFEHLSEVGLAIPFHHYFEFLRNNSMPSARDPERQVTYEEHLMELFEWEEFQSDSMARFQALQNFRVFARENGEVDAALVETVLGRTAEIFPGAATPLSFLPSSNLEAALEWDGTGLYEAAFGCGDDDGDADDGGPSRCDESPMSEAGIRRAIKKVWTSLYTFRAFDARALYGISQEQVGMAILVVRDLPGALATGVAFTGNVTNPLDERFVVSVQVPEPSVANRDPGALPEKDVLEVAAGAVTRIIRSQRSTLVPPGSSILSDEQLRELGSFLSFLEGNFPVDTGGHSRDDVLLRVGFALEADNTFAFPQVRPFLLLGAPPLSPTFLLEIPEATLLCGSFGLAGPDRGPREEYALKSQVRLLGGTIELPTSGETFAVDLVDELALGPEQELAVARSQGRFRVLSLPGADGLTFYRFTYEQDFSLSGGRDLELRIVSPLVFEALDGEPVEERRTLGGAFLVAAPGREALQANLNGEPLVRYASCSYESLPRWEVVAELEDGNRLVLEERWDPAESLRDSGPASLIRATFVLDGSPIVVTDYWRLVYSAFRHNTSVRYWVVFEAPLDVRGIDDPVYAIELVAPEEIAGIRESAHYLGADFAVVGNPAVTIFRKNATGTRVEFQRGDVGANGFLDIADAIALLNYLFRRGQPPGCLKSGDANDDGRLNVVDAVDIVRQLLRARVPLPPPFPDCGTDPTADGLTCDSSPACK